MVDYKYTYFILGVIFFVVWLFLYYHRKDARHQMLIMSVIFGFLGPIADILYLKDWWTPENIFSFLKFEAIMVGFMIGGIGTALYEIAFHKKLILSRVSQHQQTIDTAKAVGILVLGVLIYFSSYYYLDLNSLKATMLSLFIPTIIIWHHRRDLVGPSILTGLGMVLVASLVYSATEFITPGWIEEFWHFKNVPPVIILNLPIDDIFWYFFSGMFLGPFYEYYHEAKLRNLNKVRA